MKGKKKMKTSNLVILISSIFLSSCDSTYIGPPSDVVLPSEFTIANKHYSSDHKWASNHRGEYSLGEVIGYLIHEEDVENFTKEYPKVEYVAFDTEVGKIYDYKYDRVPVYELNEYEDCSIIAVYDYSYIYKILNI